LQGWSESLQAARKVFLFGACCQRGSRDARWLGESTIRKEQLRDSKRNRQNDDCYEDETRPTAEEQNDRHDDGLVNQVDVERATSEPFYCRRRPKHPHARATTAKTAIRNGPSSQCLFINSVQPTAETAQTAREFVKPSS
jgi:hypothetical protein